MLHVEMDQQSLSQGRAAGLTGGRMFCPADVPDRLAYASGFVEGKALLSLSKGRSALVTKIRSSFDAPQGVVIPGRSSTLRRGHRKRCCHPQGRSAAEQGATRP